MYVDEVDIHLNSKAGPNQRLHGTQLLVITNGKNEKRDLTHGYDLFPQQLIYVQGDRKASWLSWT